LQTHPAPAPSRRLDDDSLIALLRREERAAVDYQGTLAALREQALSFYDRQPYGDEQEGASQVVTSEFADVIESLMPGLVRVFTATDALARFAPAAPGQERWAREASEYVPHVLMRQNDGFRIVSALLKDALMYRLGGVTVDLEDAEETLTLPVNGLTRDAIDLLAAEAIGQGARVTIEVVRDETTDGMIVPAIGPAAPMPEDGAGFAGAPEPTWSGSIVLVHDRPRVVVDSIAPQDILFTPTARDEDDASFVGFVKRVTASELAKLGLGADEIESLASAMPAAPPDVEPPGGVFGPPARGAQDSERPLWLVVAWLRADEDGDGVSEHLRVIYAHAGGDAGRIVERTAWEGPVPMALATPILMPHAIVGRSLFDQTQDLQQIGSVLTRGLLDNLYLVNRPRPVISDHVNIDSLIDWTPGSPIRLKAGERPGDDHIAWLQVPNVTAGALTALEYLASVRENRTGVSRYNQGLDAESLNKTLGGLDRIMSASQQRQDLIARVFAETAMKRLYRLVYRAVRRAARGPVRYWTARGGFAHCEPSRWPDDLELTVDVVGIGNREQALQHLAMVGALQEKLIALQGGKADGPFVTAENIANAAQKLTETLGYKTAGLFFQPPDAVAQQAAVPSPPPPDPAAALAQVEARIVQERAATDLQIRRDKAAAEVAIAWFKARERARIERYKAGLRDGDVPEIAQRDSKIGT
jgi:hypothetical protein